MMRTKRSGYLDLRGACEMSISVNTACPEDGDMGCGDVTDIRLTMDSGRIGVWANTFGSGKPDHEFDCEWLAIKVRGDAECRALARVLEFATQILRGDSTNGGDSKEDSDGK